MGKVQPKAADTPSPDTAAFVHEKVLSLLSRSPSTILDVPSGQGAFAGMAQKIGHNVVCGDIDTSRFRLPKTPCHVIDLNGVWPFDDESFDHVVAIEGIEHLENPWHFVREAKRVLKDGGCLIITTPNVLTIKSRLSYLLYGYPNYFHYMVEPNHLFGGENPIDHINPISFLELRHVLIRNGLQIEVTDTNRYVNTGSILSQLLKVLIRQRGKTHVKNDAVKTSVRNTLLSPTLLFGEVLIIRARK